MAEKVKPATAAPGDYVFINVQRDLARPRSAVPLGTDQPQADEWAQAAHVDGRTDIHRTATFYYLQNLCFGAKLEGQTFGVASTSSQALNQLRIEEERSAAHLRLSQVVIEHMDWAQCIERYDRPHTLFYYDPPHWSTTGYGVDFDLEQSNSTTAWPSVSV